MSSAGSMSLKGASDLHITRMTHLCRQVPRRSAWRCSDSPESLKDWPTAARRHLGQVPSCGCCAFCLHNRRNLVLRCAILEVRDPAPLGHQMARVSCGVYFHSRWLPMFFVHAVETCVQHIMRLSGSECGCAYFQVDAAGHARVIRKALPLKVLNEMGPHRVVSGERRKRTCGTMMQRSDLQWALQWCPASAAGLLACNV